MAQSKGLRFKAWSMCRKSGWLTKKLGEAFEHNFLQLPQITTLYLGLAGFSVCLLLCSFSNKLWVLYLYINRYFTGILYNCTNMLLQNIDQGNVQ